MCARNLLGLKAPDLRIKDLRLSDIKRILPKAALNNVKAIDFCGAYGYPILANDLMEIVEFLHQHSNAKLTIYTNGGVRTPSWWKTLARSLPPGSQVNFAIDGLADTHAIHRRGVNFDRLIENAKAFIAAGGHARAEFLVFQHNAHQCNDVRKLCKSLGFKEFNMKRTDRFLEPYYETSPETDYGANINRYPIFDENRNVINFLRTPNNSDYVNQTVSNYHKLLKQGSLDHIFDKTPITCRVQKTNSVFVSATAHAFPCCWVYVQATRANYQGIPKNADQSVAQLIKQNGGWDALDLHQHYLMDIIKGDFFQAVAQSWSCSSIKNGKLKVCSRACGTEFPAYFNQFVDNNFVPQGLSQKKDVSPIIQSK